MKRGWGCLMFFLTVEICNCKTFWMSHKGSSLDSLAFFAISNLKLCCIIKNGAESARFEEGFVEFVNPSSFLRQQHHIPAVNGNLGKIFTKTFLIIWHPTLLVYSMSNLSLCQCSLFTFTVSLPPRFDEQSLGKKSDIMAEQDVTLPYKVHAKIQYC